MLSLSGTLEIVSVQSVNDLDGDCTADGYDQKHDGETNVQDHARTSLP